MDTTFLGGGVCGFVYAGIIGWILFRMREAQLKMGHRDRPLDKFPDSAHPDLTPSKLMATSRRAHITYILLIILLVIFVLAYPGVVLVLMNQG